MRLIAMRALRSSSLLLLGVAAGVCAYASASEYPTKPIRMLVGFAPGGGTDIVARLVGPKLGAALGQQVIIDNRAGAGGNIATEIVARSAPDGYTLLMGTIASLAINPSLQPNLPFDPVKDFAPVTQTASVNNIIVTHPSLPVSTLKEFVDYAKARPGQVAYASSGVGSTGHLAGALFNRVAGIELTHVPYKGGGPAITDLLGGNIKVFFAVVSTAIPHVKAGKIKALAVTTGRRAAALPDVPTVSELGYKGYEANNWYGLVAPARTPRPIIDRLNKQMVAILALSDVRDVLIAQGLDPQTTTPDAFGAYIKSELAKWAKVVADTGAKSN